MGIRAAISQGKMKGMMFYGSAYRIVKAFRAAGYKGWTMKHAFFADMGGFRLKAPEYPAFPLDAEQLLYVIQNKYVDFPDFDTSDIDDKNKTDGLARCD